MDHEIVAFTKKDLYGREYLSSGRLNLYIHQCFKTKQWAVICEDTDRPVTDMYKTKQGAINEWIRAIKTRHATLRPLPGSTGRVLTSGNRSYSYVAGKTAADNMLRESVARQMAGL